MSITAALQWCFAGFSLGCRKAKNNIRADKVLHQPGNSLVDYKSSEARVVPARQREESRSCGRNGNPSWHFSPFIKSSSVAALHACPLQSVRRFSGQTRRFFFYTLLRNLKTCLGVRRLVVVVSREVSSPRALIYVCLQAAVDWSSAVHLRVSYSSCFLYVSTTQAGSREEEKKKEREREVGFQRLCRLKWICYLGIYLFKNIIESVIYTLSIFQGFNRILSKSFIQIVNFGLKWSKHITILKIYKLASGLKWGFGDSLGI